MTEKLRGLAKELAEHKHKIAQRQQRWTGLEREMHEYKARLIERRQERGRKLFYRHEKLITQKIYKRYYFATRIELFGEYVLTRAELGGIIRGYVLEACYDYIGEIDSRNPPSWARKRSPREAIVKRAESKVARWHRGRTKKLAREVFDFLGNARRGIPDFAYQDMRCLESRQRFAVSLVKRAKGDKILTALQADTLRGLVQLNGDYTALSERTGVKEPTLRRRASDAHRKLVPWARCFLGLDARGRAVDEADENIKHLWQDSITGGYVWGITKIIGDEEELAGF